MFLCMVVQLLRQTMRVANVEHKLRRLFLLDGRQRATREAQKAVLTGRPAHLDRWNGEAYKTVVLDVNVGFPDKAILEGGSEPGVYEAGDVDGSGGDKVVPVCYQLRISGVNGRV